MLVDSWLMYPHRSILPHNSSQIFSLINGQAPSMNDSSKCQTIHFSCSAIAGSVTFDKLIPKTPLWLKEHWMASIWKILNSIYKDKSNYLIINWLSPVGLQHQLSSDLTKWTIPVCKMLQIQDHRLKSRKNTWQGMKLCMIHCMVYHYFLWK